MSGILVGAARTLPWARTSSQLYGNKLWSWRRASTTAPNFRRWFGMLEKHL
jgi:hypothetical protein